MAKTDKIDIKSLVFDDKNYNRGNAFGNSLIEKSLSKFGAGRSILLDKNNRIIAGNKTIENAGAVGMEDIIVVETTGNQIVAVKRTDIDLDSKIGREMALADNASAKASITWDAEVLKDDWQSEELADWGVRVDFDASELNEMNEGDLDLTEEFDPVGTSKGQQRVVFIFDGPDEAESYLKSINVEFKKQNMAWQVNLSTPSI